MERKKLAIAFAFAAAFLLLASGFGDVFASASNTATLPDWAKAFIVKTLGPNATASEIATVENIWIKQFALNEQRIKETNGAVLDAEHFTATLSNNYMAWWRKDEPLYGGQVIGGSYLVGSSDNLFARCYTPYVGQGASVVGEMTDPQAHGDYYLKASLGPTGEGQNGNYFIVMGGNNLDDPPDVWIYHVVGVIHVTWPYSWPWSGTWYFVGYNATQYRYISVGVNTMMGPGCTYNDVMADSIYCDML
jgi:hypothetical protein